MEEKRKDTQEELRQILLQHAQRYPRMQPTDAVKLIYQNEFGGGHLIRDEEGCRRYLRSEYASVEKNPDMLRTETIGNGIVRVNLAALAPEELEELGTEFIRSAALHRGSLENFRKKLQILAEMVENSVFSFGLDELNAYLAQYEKAGFPPVSHSPEYRESYRPAYRVVLRKP